MTPIQPWRLPTYSQSANDYPVNELEESIHDESGSESSRSESSTSEDSSVISESESIIIDGDTHALSFILELPREEAVMLARAVRRHLNGTMTDIRNLPVLTEQTGAALNSDNIVNALLFTPVSIVGFAMFVVIRARLGCYGLTMAGATSMQEVGRNIMLRQVAGGAIQTALTVPLVAALSPDQLARVSDALTRPSAQVLRQVGTHFAALLSNEIGFTLFPNSSDSPELDRALGRHVVITGLALMQCISLLSRCFVSAYQNRAGRT